MKQTQKETTDHYPLVNPVQYFPALPLHSVDISSISGIIYSALKVYFCYKIIKRAFFWGTLGGFPWALGKTVLSAKPQSIGSDCKLAGLSGFWDMQMLHLVSTVFLKRWISFHIKKKSRFWTIWDLISLAPHVGRLMILWSTPLKEVGVLSSAAAPRFQSTWPAFSPGWPLRTPG